MFVGTIVVPGALQRAALASAAAPANPNDPGENWVETNTPFRARFRDLRIGGLVVQPEAIAWTLTGVVAAALVIHGFGMKKMGRTDGGADFEPIREWVRSIPKSPSASTTKKF